ncbi:hypothetical protein MSAN_00671400 [Mycena sanguinolenta]|uniref:WW domain-containing protein n=1 Tax=Mycena sanguinolenta TaxID=230812 RepID=A0A8H6Z4H5_9AGAR|nr:hypothetical protein MSAN_00671400 [Mycena sanguinolenta]
MASYQNVLPGAEFQLSFRPTTNANGGYKYRFNRGTPVKMKHFDDSAQHDERSLHHTTFLHGFSISLSQGIWGRLFGQVTVSDFADSDLDIRNSRSDLVPFGSQGSLFSWSLSFFNGGQGSGKKYTDQDGEQVILSDLSQTSETVHPGRTINNFLLSQYPESAVVMTHDDDWRDILRDDGTEATIENTRELLERISEQFTMQEEDVAGTIFLVSKTEELGDKRGRFPFNYVNVMSDGEAQLDFSHSEQTFPERQTNNSVLDLSHAMMRGTQAENEEWLDAEIGSLQGGGMDKLANSTLDSPLESSDFWMPEVTADGQIYYVNMKTGQHTRDLLPTENFGDSSDSDSAGSTNSQSSSSSGTSASLGLSNDLLQGGSMAGFGLLRRTSTPEPWVKKLADNGMSYYYYNKSDGTVQWTRPETSQTTRICPLPPTSRIPPTISRLSLYSDESDIQPREPRQNQDGYHRRPRPSIDTKMRLTSAERIAQSLQQAIAPPPADLVTDLSAVARGAIQAVIKNIEAAGIEGRVPGEGRKMDVLVSAVVLAIRNLLYVSGASTVQIPSNALPRNMRNLKPSSTSSPLKPAQRKVTATLSRLVLSARALQYDAGSTVTDTLDRIQVDAEELERAVLTFVLDVQRFQHSTPSLLETTPRCLHDS